MTRQQIGRIGAVAILGALSFANLAPCAEYRDGVLVTDSSALSVLAQWGELQDASNRVVAQAEAAVASSGYLTNNASMQGLYYTFQTNGVMNNTSLLVVTDAGGGNPDALGNYTFDGATLWTNVLRWNWDGIVSLNSTNMTDTYDGTLPYPVTALGSGGDCPGSVLISYGTMTIVVTNTGRFGLAGNMGTNRLYFSVAPYTTTNWPAFIN